MGSNQDEYSKHDEQPFTSYNSGGFVMIEKEPEITVITTTTTTDTSSSAIVYLCHRLFSMRPAVPVEYVCGLYFVVRNGCTFPVLSSNLKSIII